MTPIDYGTNPAAAVGIPGINLNESTSGMTQLVFQNIRNLGANSNQPLITNQNDFQIFDSVTKVSGKHTMKVGRQRHLALARDPERGHDRRQLRLQQQPDLELRGHHRAAARVNSATGFDVASFLLGYATAKTRNLFDAETYTEKRPEYALYVQDDWRATSKLTLNLGLRWDVFVPWVEVDDRQSNFDVSTGRFVVASPDAVINGVKVGRYLQTYSKKDFGPRFGFAYDLSGDGKTVVRGGVGDLLELHARRHLVLEGAEPAVPAVDVAQHHLRPHPEACRTACRRRPAWTRTVRPPATRARSSTSTSATPTRPTST